MKTVIIAAVSLNGIIGSDGTMPWLIRSELKHFKSATLGHAIIVGRKTLASLPPLKDRQIIVLSRNMSVARGDAIIANTMESAIAMAMAYANSKGQDKIFIAGGATIYEQAMKFADEILLSRINIICNGDAKFPPIDQSEFHASETNHQAVTDDNISWMIERYTRIQSSYLSVRSRDEGR